MIEQVMAAQAEFNTNSGFAIDFADSGATQYSALSFPVTRAEFDAEHGTPTTGGTRALKRGTVRWAEYENADGTLKARWVSRDASSDIGYGFVL
jgi:hypothetical protein